jgi:hypothetical protein
MPALSRREFFRKAATDAAVAGLLAACATDLRANPLGLPIGSQTWPHRAMIKQDFPGLLKQLADIGVQRIELCSPFGYAEFAGLTNGAEVRKVIADHGLGCQDRRRQELLRRAEHGRDERERRLSQDPHRLELCAPGALARRNSIPSNAIALGVEARSRQMAAAAASAAIEKPKLSMVSQRS